MEEKIVVEPLFGGADLRCEQLKKAIKDIIYERGIGIPIPSIIGVIDIVKFEMYEEQKLYVKD